MYGYPTSWIPVARNTHRFACGDASGNLSGCRHTSSFTCNYCHKGKHSYAILKNGDVIRVEIRVLNASNGERAALPFPVSKEDYDKVMKCDGEVR